MPQLDADRWGSLRTLLEQALAGRPDTALALAKAAEEAEAKAFQRELGTP
jgi:hypothetical protein